MCKLLISYRKLLFASRIFRYKVVHTIYNGQDSLSALSLGLWIFTLSRVVINDHTTRDFGTLDWLSKDR